MSNNGELQTRNNSPENGGTNEDTKALRKVKYPKSVFFIISNEFCERFSYYGMRTILSIYLQFKLKYSETDSTLIYHTFVMLCYFFPIIGAILADSFWGKFKTILYLSIIYAIGCITLALSSTRLWFFSLSERGFSLLGLLLIAIGTGGIKPCVSSFGGDQFVLPEQEKQLEKFFSIFYFAINAGSLISAFLTPDLRQDVHCLGAKSCYPLAFGIPAVLMVVSIIAFVLGSFMYKNKKPDGNIIVEVTKCSLHAVAQKIRSKAKHSHWLDYAGDKYSSKLIADTKVLMSLIVLCSPTVLFWALYEQQGTAWVFQAEKMNGQVGDFMIKPDQMQVVNAILILLFIPIFEMIIYPILYKLHLVRSSIQKMVVGGLLAAASFGTAAGIEYYLQPTYEKLPESGLAQLRLINGFNCPASVTFNHDSINYAQDINEFGIWQMHSLKCKGNETIELSVTINKSNCPSLKSTQKFKKQVTISEAHSVSWLFFNKPSAPKKLVMEQISTSDIIKKAESGNSRLRVVYHLTKDEQLELAADDQTVKFALPRNSYVTNTTEVDPRLYQFKLNGNVILKDERLLSGGVYTLLIMNHGGKTGVNIFEISPPNTVHMLWQLVPITVITVSEIMFSIPSLEFSYSQAPISMKSIISALFLLSDSIGNLLVVVIAGIFEKQTRLLEFSVYAVMMALIMLVFAMLAKNYKYVVVTDKDESSGIHDKPKNSEDKL